MGKALENSIVHTKLVLNGLMVLFKVWVGAQKQKLKLMNIFIKKQKHIRNNDLSKIFKILKKYKWGTNIYYSLSGKYRIHQLIFR